MKRIPIWLAAGLTFAWLLAAAVAAAEPPPDLQTRVAAAVAAMNNLDYDQAVKILEAALAEAGNAQIPEAVEAHKQLGLAYLALRKQDQAIDQFRQALTIDRRALLDPDVASPEAIALFESVRKGLASQPPAPSLAPVVGPPGRAGRPLSIEVRAADAAAVAGVVVHYRQPGAPTYESAEMTPSADGRFVFAVPGDEVGTRGIEYYIEASPAGGGPPAKLGDANAPLTAAVQKESAAGDGGLAFGKWFTLSLGAVGVGTGVFFTASSAATSNAAAKQRRIDHPNTARRLTAWVSRFNNASIACYVSGAALWGVSGALFAVDAKRAAKNAADAPSDRLALYPSVTPDAAGAVVVWSFR
jgi:hypothetical protein